MNKNTIAIVMIVAGIALLAWGYSMSEAFDSKVNRFFSGSPTDKAMWTMIVGGALTAAGAFQLFIRKK